MKKFYIPDKSINCYLLSHKQNVTSVIFTTNADWYPAKYLKYWCKCDVILSVVYLTRQTVNSLHECVYSVVSISWYTAALFAQDLPEAFLEKYFTYSCINNVNGLLTSASQTADLSPEHDTLWIIVHFRVSVELLDDLAMTAEIKRPQIYRH